MSKIEVVLGCGGEPNPVYTADGGGDIFQAGNPVSILCIKRRGADDILPLWQIALNGAVDALNKSIATKPVVKPNPTCDSCRFSHAMKKEFDWCICRYSPPRRNGESIEVKKDFWCGKHEEKAVR